MTKEQRDALLYQPKNGYDRLTQAALALVFAEKEAGFCVVGSALETVQKALRDAVESASKQNGECVGIVGLAEPTLKNLTDRAAVLNSERMVLVAPDVYVWGESTTDKMVGFACDRTNGYKCEMKLFDLSDYANFEKKFPRERINAEGNNVTEAFAKYALPLIQGETKLEKEDGLPRFARLKKVFAK